ncbi:MAG: hypothetical protein SOX72_07855 [Oscillospiraceae bacterium]|nr:hypothetical protein [Oscillospiraceae bacterium]MDY4192111.1 hypothetical protein [Oscillospiraceae bacterium]
MIDKEVAQVTDWIAGRFHPRMILLYSRKTDVQGKLSSFKICVVADVPDKEAMEEDIFLHVDSDVPYDVISYFPEEWDRLTKDKNSFASRIIGAGSVIYYG